MTDDQQCAEMARQLLTIRDDRKSLFPSELFDEYAWDMLLYLFIATAEDGALAEQRLIALSGAPPETGRRWVAHLSDTGHVARTEDERIRLTPDTQDRLRRFLRGVTPEIGAP